MSHFGKSKFLTRALLLVMAVFLVVAMASIGWAATSGDVLAVGSNTGEATRNNGPVTGTLSGGYAVDAYYVGNNTPDLVVAISVDIDPTALGSTGDVISADAPGTVTFATPLPPADNSAPNGKIKMTISGWTTGSNIVIDNICTYSSGGTRTSGAAIAKLTITPVPIVPTLMSSSADYTVGETPAVPKDMTLTPDSASGVTALTFGTIVSMNGSPLSVPTATGVKLWADGQLSAYKKADNTGIIVSPDAALVTAKPQGDFNITGSALLAKVGTDSNIVVAMQGSPTLATFTAKVDPANIKLTPSSKDFTVGVAALSTDQVDVSINPALLGPNPVSLDLLDGMTAGTSFTVNGTLAITASSSDHKIKFSGTPSTITSTPKTYKVRWLTGGGVVLSADLTVNVKVASTTPTLSFEPASPKFYTGDTVHEPITVKPSTGTISSPRIGSADLTSITRHGLTFTISAPSTTSPNAVIAVTKDPSSTVTAGKTSFRVFATVSGDVISKDLTVAIVEGTSFFTLDPPSMIFDYNDYKAKTLTIAAPTSSIEPTVTASDTTKLKVGKVQSTTTSGTYTVTVEPASGFTYGAGDATASVRVYFGSDTSSAKTVPVTLKGSGTSSTVPVWSDMSAAHISAISTIASVAGAPTTDIKNLAKNAVVISMPGSTTYGSEINRGSVAAYLALEQSVTRGGVVGMNFNGSHFMTLVPTGVGTNVNQQLHVPTSNTDFHDRYDIVKVFGSGSNSVSLSLSQLIPGFFTYNPASRTVTANGVFAVIDSPAPPSSTSLPNGVKVAYAGAGTQYGVVYSANYNGTAYIVICDGVADGVAKDPIMMVQNYRGGSSGGGCAAGFGAFALVALGGIALLRRRNG